MFYYTSACSSSFVNSGTPESTAPPPSTHRSSTSFDGSEGRTLLERGLLRSHEGRQLWRRRWLATRHAPATEGRHVMVVGTGRLHLTQTSETSFQETTRHRGWYASAVAGRSRRHDEGQRRQRRYGLSPHDDRRLLESGLVCSHEEQVRGVVGKSAAIHVRRRLPPDLADGSRQIISEQIRSGAIEALRHPLLLHAQRGDEGSRRGTVQPNVEDAHVALLHETPDVAVRRHPSGLDAIV